MLYNVWFLHLSVGKRKDIFLNYIFLCIALFAIQNIFFFSSLRSLFYSFCNVGLGHSFLASRRNCINLKYIHSFFLPSMLFLFLELSLLCDFKYYNMLKCCCAVSVHFLSNIFALSKIKKFRFSSTFICWNQKLPH